MKSKRIIEIDFVVRVEILLRVLKCLVQGDSLLVKRKVIQ